MKSIPAVWFALASLMVSHSALAQHVVYLRGIVNVPGCQVALMQIDHQSWSVQSGGHFEDRQAAGAHFFIDVREVDLTNEIVKTRIAGVEYTNHLSAPGRPAVAKSWIHMQGADFGDMLDLIDHLTGRVSLLHPEVDRSLVSCETSWVDAAPDAAVITGWFAQWLNQRGATAIEDGARFLQIVPAAMARTVSLAPAGLRSGDAPGGVISFENFPAATAVEIYAKLAGRIRRGNEPVAGTIAHFKATGLSREETLYALGTLIAWNGTRIVQNADHTFSLARVSPPSGR